MFLISIMFAILGLIISICINIPWIIDIACFNAVLLSNLLNIIFFISVVTCGSGLFPFMI